MLGGVPTPADDKPRNKGGRPRVEVPGVRITTWIPAPDYDRLYALAQKHDSSVSGVVRELLRVRLPKPPTG
jgi:hypothetical protein